MRHQIGVVRNELRAEIRSAASSYGSAARCAERLRLSVGVQKRSAAPPLVFLCGFDPCILWSCILLQTQKTQTKATDGGPVFFFSSSVVKKHSATDATVFDGSGFIWEMRPTSSDVAYINTGVSDDSVRRSRGPAKAGTQNDGLKPAL